MIKVAYNYQTFTHQKYGGISRIFSEIVPLINQHNDFETTIYAGLYRNKYLADMSGVENKGWHFSYPDKAIKIFLAMNSIFSKVAMKIDSPDIVHETYYSIFNAAPKNSKVVITVLDMVHEKFSDSMQSPGFLAIKANAIRRADHIICISESTKKDLIEILNIDPQKISVIYLGCTIDQTSLNHNNDILPDNYILYVGQRNPVYKNFTSLIKAYGENKKIQENFKLVCFGSDPLSRREVSMIESNGINPDSVCNYSGSDSLLSKLYQNASAFVYPSLYEGFGIPPLEAMSFNCPVVCSSLSSIPEVVGDAGEYFDPYDINSISESLERVLFSPSIQQELIIKGKERIQRFSWEKCAQETEAVYKNLMDIT